MGRARRLAESLKQLLSTARRWVPRSWQWAGLRLSILKTWIQRAKRGTARRLSVFRKNKTHIVLPRAAAAEKNSFKTGMKIGAGVVAAKAAVLTADEAIARARGGPSLASKIMTWIGLGATAELAEKAKPLIDIYNQQKPGARIPVLLPEQDVLTLPNPLAGRHADVWLERLLEMDLQTEREMQELRTVLLAMATEPWFKAATEDALKDYKKQAWVNRLKEIDPEVIKTFADATTDWMLGEYPDLMNRLDEPEIRDKMQDVYLMHLEQWAYALFIVTEAGADFEEKIAEARREAQERARADRSGGWKKHSSRQPR